jgi:YD repeat-containing protein
MGNCAMKTLYDADSDALYVRFSDALVLESQEVSEGVVLDYDAEGRIVAIELLDASKHLAAGTKFPTAAE